MSVRKTHYNRVNARDPLTPEELSNEPDDVTLDVDEDPRVDRRVLAECKKRGRSGSLFWGRLRYD